VTQQALQQAWWTMNGWMDWDAVLWVGHHTAYLQHCVCEPQEVGAAGAHVPLPWPDTASSSAGAFVHTALALLHKPDGAW
jgi:hypothetical protein